MWNSILVTKFCTLNRDFTLNRDLPCILAAGKSKAKIALDKCETVILCHVLQCVLKIMCVNGISPVQRMLCICIFNVCILMLCAQCIIYPWLCGHFFVPLRRMRERIRERCNSFWAFFIPHSFSVFRRSIQILTSHKVKKTRLLESLLKSFCRELVTEGLKIIIPSVIRVTLPWSLSGRPY